jgi:hypothetical protein
MAWDGQEVAIDSLSTSGSMVVTRNADKAFTAPGRLAVGCGQADRVSAVARFLLGQTDHLPDVSGWEFCVWVFSKDGDHREYIDSVDTWTKILGKDAAGSGREVALTALHLGMSAHEAIGVASELDVYTGGVVRAFSIPLFLT